jgi:hypothetical protein
MNLRLDQARGLVTQTELPISDIAAIRSADFARIHLSCPWCFTFTQNSC